ncbi:MAG: hypothetical protein ACMG6E_04780 [Candidatus Roizmanbacteria bacterium]
MSVQAIKIIVIAWVILHLIIHFTLALPLISLSVFPLLSLLGIVSLGIVGL